VVFADPVQCSRFALVLLQKVKLTRWQNWGLPPELTIRVGMHAGPVLVGWDPVVRHDNFFGPHVSYAQLIEPITTPGCAFATAQFAACLATSAEAHEFSLEYVGSSVLDSEIADAEAFADLTPKEKQDYARCHLYNLTENKGYSATRVPVNVDTNNQPTLEGGLTPSSTVAAAAAVQAAVAAVEAAGTDSPVVAQQQLQQLSGAAAAAFELGAGLAAAASDSASGTPTLSRRPSFGAHLGAPSLTRAPTHRPGRVGLATSPRLGPVSVSGSSAATAPGVSMGSSGGSTPSLMSPSLTYSLLKLEELRTERENALQALELQQAQEQQAAAAKAAVAKAEAEASATPGGARRGSNRRRSHRASGGPLGTPMVPVPPVGRVGGLADFAAGAPASASSRDGGVNTAAAGTSGPNSPGVHLHRRNRSRPEADIGTPGSFGGVAAAAATSAAGGQPSRSSSGVGGHGHPAQQPSSGDAHGRPRGSRAER